MGMKNIFCNFVPNKNKSPYETIFIYFFSFIGTRLMP